MEYENSKNWSNTTGTGLLLRWYTLVPLRGREREKGSQAERTFAKMCSVPTHRLTDPISDWNYLWTGINRLFDYEPGWHKKVTNMTKMQLMNFFVTLGSGKLQCDAHHIHKWQSAAVGDGELSGDRCLLSVPGLQAWSCLALSPFVVRLILVVFF